MNIWKLLVAGSLTLTLSVYASSQTPEIQLEEQIIYGQGNVSASGELKPRDLWMDAFLPASDTPTAAIFMTFGGAYHRGHPHHPYNMEGFQTTSMRDYCKMFAEQGYACFNIDYRVAPELPKPDKATYDETALNMQAVPLLGGQANLVRSIMGLEPLDFTDPADLKMMEDTILSAAEDLQKAVRFVKSNAESYNIDPDKIVLGGFSAGAINSLNVSHGMKEPVAGTIMLGTAELGFDLQKLVSSPEDANPILMFLGQYDLPAALSETPKLLAHYQKVGVDYDFNWVPGVGHFYPSGAVALSFDGVRKSVEERMLDFVERVTR